MPVTKPPGGTKRAKATNGKRTAAKKPVRPNRAFAEAIAGMQELVDTLKDGGMDAVEKNFRVTRLYRQGPPPVPAAAATAARAALGMSEWQFALWLGVGKATVQKWEEGAEPATGAAARLITEVNADPDYWRKRVADGGT